ncbi:MAG TPA: aromatic hydrocarbon degradation protein [Sulfurimonas sp. UBA12504]|nr:MAG: aromatic hydrocarbon degradation protein [Sulfurimonas sp. GWF2_37_8]DAB30989.1 MAG TPA: aromatic hydrocarbon degradation protein [Sulfurimonas sp. UBA12504]
MKKTIKLAVVAALALGTTSAFATNGSNLIGLGAEARGMGGVGIGMAHGAESGLANGALITSVESTEISFGGTIFMPKVSNENTLWDGVNPPFTSSEDSAANMSVIPEVSIASKVTDNFYMGVGMWGTAGMGVDYRDANSIMSGGAQMQMVTNLQLMQFGVPLAYKTSGLSLSITPVLQYGSLDINYEHPGQPNGLGGYIINPGTNYGTGVAQDLKFGYNLGASYEISGVTIGAVYKSQIDMEYEGVMSKTVNAFSTTGTYANDVLSTPAEMGIGASYTFSGNTIAIDYKRIKWSDAKGYQDFEWEDQNVLALGYQYATSDWAARVGYNYSKSPISEQTVVNPGTDVPNSAGLQPGTVNTFNLLGFPGIVESHITVGGTYNVSKQTSVDLAYAYAPEVTNTYKNFAAQDITTKHSQSSVSAQVNFKF